ncbi:MAG TPA: hypothetical protein VGX68_18005 [Thermoanaerobaculia bacterium]|jgi:hypothetical protein|nr:hypothetical protein [Thermoanaerobaculia bacterium]
MNKSFFLTLMIGPAVPVPVPQAVLDALTSVRVTTTSEANQPSVFELTFTLSNRSPLHTLFLLAGGAVPPVLRVLIIVTIGGSPEVLMDGVVTEQHVSPGGTAGQSTLTVKGTDLTAVMDLIPFDGLPYPAMPAEAQVALILAKYAVFGVIPLVIPSLLIDIPLPTNIIPRHKGTDLQHVRKLAANVGYVFYLKPGPAPLMNFAYWGPQIKVGVPQPALNINMDAHTNVEELSFDFNAEAKVLPILVIHNQESKVTIPIPIPDIGPLNPPLGAVPPIPKKIRQIKTTAKFNAIRAALLGLAKAARSSDAVTGQGRLDVIRYGRVLRARELVGVRGAGVAFDGLHYVKSVTHDIKRGEYKQSFSLSRNGLISTVPRVPV